MVRTMDSRVSHYFLALKPQKSLLTILGLSFCICKVGRVLAIRVNEKGFSIGKGLVQGPAHREHSVLAIVFRADSNFLPEQNSLGQS